MSIRVRVGGQVIEFPDGTSEKEMRAALEQLPGPVSGSASVSESRPAGGTGNAKAESPADVGARVERELRESGFGSVVDGMQGGGVLSAAPGMVTAGPRIIKGLAQRLYNGLLKPSKQIRQEFGDEVVTGALNNRRLITKGGADAADAAVDASRKTADDMIASTPRPSQGVSPRRVVREFRPVQEAVQARVDAGVVPASELGRVANRARRIQVGARRTGGRFQPERAQTLKRTSQEAAEGAYAQMQGRSKKMLDTDDLLDAATARGFKGGIEDIVPGIAAQNQTTQKLIGEARALAEAVGRTSNHLPFGSVSDLAAMTAGAATNPAVGIVGKLSTMAGPGSAMAIGLNEASKLGLDDVVQRALLQAMKAWSDQQ